MSRLQRSFSKGLLTHCSGIIGKPLKQISFKLGMGRTYQFQSQRVKGQGHRNHLLKNLIIRFSA